MDRFDGSEMNDGVRDYCQSRVKIIYVLRYSIIKSILVCIPGTSAGVRGTRTCTHRAAVC